MLTKTSLLAMRLLVHLGRNQGIGSLSPARIAVVVEESPTYLAKVTGLLVRAGILRAERGAKGGVQLIRVPEEITMLAVVEACQGTIVGDYCQVTKNVSLTCAFHQASLELQQAIVGVLVRWTLADLLAQPGPLAPLPGNMPCRLAMLAMSEKAVAGTVKKSSKKGTPGRKKGP